MSDLANTIGEIASSIEQFKAEQRSKLDQLETRMSRPGAFHGLETAATARAKATPEQRAAFGQFLRTGEQRHALEAKADINATSPGEGVETVATWFDNIVTRQARDASQLLSIVRTKSVGNFPVKSIVGRSDVMGSGWAGDLSTRSGTDAPLPAAVEIGAGEWYALPTVSEWAINDLSFDVLEWLQAELVSEYAETMMYGVVGGNGTAKPQGFLAGPTPVTTADGGRAFGTLQYFVTGQAATLPNSATGIVNMLMDVVNGTRWAHRQKGKWVMNAATLSTLRKIVDADGRAILMDTLVGATKSQILGYEVVECEAMPGVGAGAFPIAFGDFNAGYLLCEENQGMRITRDGITAPGFVRFYARKRCGGKVLDSEALKLIKVSA